jgi:hypothetical protein
MSATRDGGAVAAPGYGVLGGVSSCSRWWWARHGIADRQLRAVPVGAWTSSGSVRRARRWSSCWRGSAISWCSEVTVLADDNRIRSTVLAPKFDEATVQDILEDLRKSSGATLLAVVDAAGKVIAVAGPPACAR